MSEDPLTRARRVVIADDHPPTRAGIRAALVDGGFEVVGEAATADDALELVRRERPEVALLDIHMPGNGIQAARRIASEMPKVAVVILTVSASNEDLFAALQAGASGYLLKDTDPERLPLALHGVLAGEAAMPRHLVAHLMEEFSSRRGRRIPLPRRRGVELTSREMEVLDQMRRGLTTAQMAEHLFVSQVTIRSHIASILKKLGVPDRASALRLVEEGEGS